MNAIELNCIGLPCPQPVLKTKEALEQGAETLVVTVDNEASKNNVERFAANQGCQVTTSELENEHFELRLECQNCTIAKDFDEEQYSCLPENPGNGLVYVISSDTMGRGNDELGWALLQTFIQTIEEVTPLPAKVIMYNSGVKLVTEQSGAINSLSVLQKQGVEILVCGTCLDFYKLKEKIKVGKISNMYEIMTSMTEASQVISPH